MPQNLTKKNTIPVLTVSLNYRDSENSLFRAMHSRDRMVNSALHFAFGFFDHLFDGRYQESIMIEMSGIRVQVFGTSRVFIVQ